MNQQQFDIIDFFGGTILGAILQVFVGMTVFFIELYTTVQTITLSQKVYSSQLIVLLQTIYQNSQSDVVGFQVQQPIMYIRQEYIGIQQMIYQAVRY